MPRVPVQFPIGGLRENEAFSDPNPIYTDDERNMRGMDPTDGRVKGAVRGGTTKYMLTAVGAGPVQRIEQVSYDAQNQEYTDLVNSLVTEWSKANPDKVATKTIKLDRQSNVYFISGNSSVVKLNSAGRELWTISIPFEDPKHACRVLEIDPDTNFLFVGVSEGGKQATAKLFCYRQKDDNKTDKVWEVEVGAFVEQARIYNTELYCLLNLPDRNRAYVRVYEFITSGEPEQSKEWEVPYPGNDLDIKAKDGAVLVASDANSQRGLDSRSPGSTQTSIDWTIDDLANKDKRLWAHFDARDRDTLAIERISEEAGDDGGEVVAWYSKTKNGRTLLANRGISTYPPVPTGEAGPTYKTSGLNGFPSISFNGQVYNGSGTSSTTGRSMVGLAPSSTDRAYRAEQLSPLPTYKGAQFALFMVFKAGIDELIRGLLSIPIAGDITTTRFLAMNRRSDDTFPGTIPMPGSVYLNESGGTASDASQSTPSAGGLSGPTGPTRLPGAGLSGSGVCVLTYIHDGGVHDGNAANSGTGTSTRSVLRINGHPVDRWQSLPTKTQEAITLGIAYLGSSGHSRFAGEIGEIIVLSDWYDQAGIQQRLVTCPTYPDSVWAANSDTEVERIEGMLAHKWGCAHELATGQAAWLNFVGNPANDETLTIDAKTYRFRNTLAQANDVKIGSTKRETGGNLYQAINRIGQPGVDYDQRTEKHSSFMALAAVNAGADPNQVMAIRSISPYLARVTLSSSSSANLTWLTATTQHTITASGATTGWFPHPFTLKKTTNSRGGPPADATNTQGQITPQYLLQSIYPMLSKWAPNTGKPTWVATSGYDVVASVTANKITTAGTGLGGVGYGVRTNSEGEIYSVGPKRATVSGDETIIADAVDIRKFGDAGSSFVTTTGGAGDPWSKAIFQASDSFEWAHMRMDVDSFHNVYVPVYYTVAAQTYTGVSLVGYRRAALAGAGVEFLRYAGMSGREGYAVASDTRKPSLPEGDTIQHGEFLYLATSLEVADTSKLSVFKLRQLSTAHVEGSVRTIVQVAVAAGSLRRISFGGSPVTVTGGSSFFSSTSYVDSAQHYGRIYLTDGIKYGDYDPKADALIEYVSHTSGQILPRMKLISSWNRRIVLARSADNAHQWCMSKAGDAYGWDAVPYTLNEEMAFAGTSETGALAPDAITALMRLSDDLLLFGGDHSIHRLTGDPASGGQFHLVSDITGVAFGRAWAKDPERNLYFFGSRGGVYRMGWDAPPVRMSLNRIERRLGDIDLEASRVELAWSDEEDGLRVMVVTATDGGTYRDSYFWERKTDSWHLDQYGRTGYTATMPSCVFVSDGDGPNDRKLLFGREDGRIAYHDRNAVNDDGQPIDSFVLIGPLTGEDVDREVMVTDLDLVTAAGQAGPNWFLYASQTAERPGGPVASGQVSPGRARRITARARGADVMIGLGLADVNERWAFEALSARIEAMGMKRGVFA